MPPESSEMDGDTSFDATTECTVETNSDHVETMTCSPAEAIDNSEQGRVGQALSGDSLSAQAALRDKREESTNSNEPPSRFSDIGARVVNTSNILKSDG